MRTRKAVSYALGVVALCLVGVAVRDVRTILELSKLQEGAAGDVRPVAPAYGAGGTTGDSDLVWVGGAAAAGSSPSAAAAERKKPLAQDFAHAAAAAGAALPPAVARAPNTQHSQPVQRGQSSGNVLSSAEMEQLAAAAKHFGHLPGDGHAVPLPQGQSAALAGSKAGDDVSHELAMNLEKLRAQLEPNAGAGAGGANRGRSMVPGARSSEAAHTDSPTATCPPPSEHPIMQLPNTADSGSFSCDWQTLGTPTIVLDPSVPLSYAFLK